MKIELVKEYEASGGEFFSIEIDGKFVSGTVTRDESVAILYYNNLVKTKGQTSKEIIKSTEI